MSDRIDANRHSQSNLLMPVPDYQNLMLPVLKLVADGEIHVGDATDRLARELNLTAEDRAMMLPSGRQSLLSNRMHWAKTYMLKAGLVRSTRRGQFAITDRGRDLLATKPLPIDNDLLMQFEKFRDFVTTGRGGTGQLRTPTSNENQEMLPSTPSCSVSSRE